MRGLPSRTGHGDPVVEVPPPGEVLRQALGQLGPRLARLASGDGDFDTFGWEAYHRTDVRRRTRKLIQALIDLTAFCAVPPAAPAVFWAGRDGGGLLVGLSLLEALAVLGLAAQVLLYTRQPRPARTPA
ncbi:hypothetical protein ACIRQQ_44220 [Streptomyces fuscichromogenes]|uniref:hypothetical protein n=1 Tax=Streptomyces fuscichromogenes TaxID=1324013 RepID=UPI0037FE480C